MADIDDFMGSDGNNISPDLPANKLKKHSDVIVAKKKKKI